MSQTHVRIRGAWARVASSKLVPTGADAAVTSGVMKTDSTGTGSAASGDGLGTTFAVSALIVAIAGRISPLVVVGHSMGGSLAAMFAGVYPEMVRRGQGRIVLTASLAGLGPSPGMAAYSASKASVTA